jgi:hypothetical protein
MPFSSGALDAKGQKPFTSPNPSAQNWLGRGDHHISGHVGGHLDIGGLGADRRLNGMTGRQCAPDRRNQWGMPVLTRSRYPERQDWWLMKEAAN